jgi:hypothetical protein
MRVVKLDDTASADRLGYRIEAENRRLGRKDRPGYRELTPESSLEIRCRSYRAQAALCQYLGRRFVEADWFECRPDVGEWEVKSSKRVDGEISLEPRQVRRYPSRRVVLGVEVSYGTFVFVGWCYYSEAPEIGVLRGGRYHISQRKLKPFPPGSGLLDGLDHTGPI